MASRIRKEPPSFKLLGRTCCYPDRDGVLADRPDLAAQATAGEENQDDGSTCF